MVLGGVVLGVVEPLPTRGGDAVVPVDPVAAPLVPPLMSAPGAAVDESGTACGRRVRPVRGVPLVEPLPIAPPAAAPLPDAPIEPPDVEPPDIELPVAPAPMLPPLVPPVLPPLVPPVLPPLVDVLDMLSLIVLRARWPPRTDELRLIVETLAVSPLVFATFVWLTRVTCRCVTARARCGRAVLSCIEDIAPADVDVEVDGCVAGGCELAVPLLLPAEEGWSEGGVLAVLPAVLLPAPVTGVCGAVDCADAAIGRIAIVASVVISLVINVSSG